MSGLPVKAPIKVEQTTDRQVNQLQTNAGQTTKALNSFPYINGAQSPIIAFAAGVPQTVNHKLGRTLIGFINVGTALGYGAFYATAWDDKTITLQSQNNCNAVFWFY